MKQNRPRINDTWEEGDLYEPFIGRWSRLVAQEFLAWLSPHDDLRWLDVGCGTGALAESIIRRAAPRSVHGIDISPGFLSLARRRIADSRASFSVGSAETLAFSDDHFDAAVSGLVLNFVPHPEQALSEMRRVTVRGGMVATYVWDYAGKMELLRYFWDAAVSLDGPALDLDEGRRFPLCHPDELTRVFTRSGLQDIQLIPIDIETMFRNFDDYWSPFLGGQGPAPSYVSSLPEARRDALRERLRSSLPLSQDGSIRCIARVWAIRGVK